MSTTDVSLVQEGSCASDGPARVKSSTYVDSNNLVSGKKKLPGYSGISSPPKFVMIFLRCCSHKPPESGWPYKAFTRSTTHLTNFSRQCFGLSSGGAQSEFCTLRIRAPGHRL